MLTLHDLVQVVDPEWVLEPAARQDVMDDCMGILLREGWSVAQVDAWSKTAWSYSYVGLRMLLTVRRN